MSAGVHLVVNIGGFRFTFPLIFEVCHAKAVRPLHRALFQFRLGKCKPTPISLLRRLLFWRQRKLHYPGLSTGSGLEKAEALVALLVVLFHFVSPLLAIHKQEIFGVASFGKL